MSLTFEEFSNLLKYLAIMRKDAQAYLDLIPEDIAQTIFDNNYANMQDRIIVKLLKTILKDYYEDVTWFLYDWKPGYTITVENTTYVINSLDDYLNYASKELEFI